MFSTKFYQNKMLRINFLKLSFQTRLYSSSRTSRKVVEEAQEKVVKVAIIGLPNSGKSTLINTILDQRVSSKVLNFDDSLITASFQVCATSEKVHTTTNYAKGIINRHNSQIIVFDTPGIVTQQEMKKHHLDEKFIKSCRHSIQHSNLIGVLHDVSNHWTRGQLHPMVLDLLNEYHTIPSFLILNKVDKLKSKRSLLDVVKVLTCNNISLKIGTKKKAGKEPPVEPEPVDKDREHEKPVEVGWPNFRGVFMVSSLNGDGVEKLVEFIESQSVSTPWEFKNNEVTDQKPPEIIEQFVRARLLDYLPQEIPYLLTPELEYFSDENNKIFASVIIKCPNERLEKLVCGVGDGKLRQITDRVTSDLIQSFKLPISLTLTTVVIKVKESN